MLIEDGRRLLLSNLDLRWVVRNSGNLLNRDNCSYSREAIQYYERFPEAGKSSDSPRLKLSTAVRMSASFPFFSPTVCLPTWPRRRVVDAGYYDNYGVSVAASYLFSAHHRDWILKNKLTTAVVCQKPGR